MTREGRPSVWSRAAAPGRKSDVNDAQCLQRLHACGLLRASLRPGPEIAAPRAYLRLRERHLDYAAAHIQAHAQGAGRDVRHALQGRTGGHRRSVAGQLLARARFRARASAGAARLLPAPGRAVRPAHRAAAGRSCGACFRAAGRTAQASSQDQAGQHAGLRLPTAAASDRRHRSHADPRHRPVPGAAARL